MKKFKGTPGKWIFNESEFPNSHDIIADSEEYIWLASIHQQFTQKTSVEQSKANAQLIAAAPELLEALQELVGHFTGFTPDELKAKENALNIINKALGL